MSGNFAETDRMMKTAAEDGIFPAASLLVAKENEIIFKGCYGSCTEDTVFDVASLTKPIITSTLYMLASEKKLVNLDDEVGIFLDYASSIRTVPIYCLLNHSSGLPTWEPYYQEVPLGDVASKSAREQILMSVGRESLVAQIGKECIYSDLGFMILGTILEKIFSRPLHNLAEELIAKPLGLKDTFYRPVGKTKWSGDPFDPAYRADQKKFEKIIFAPTEDCPWRKEVVLGFVNDQNCYAMGGVAGHAGLFSTTDDIHTFVKVLTSCKEGKNKFLSQRTVDVFVDDYISTLAYHNAGTFLLGWDRPTYAVSQSGHKFSAKTIGHLGFTGCSLWVDLERMVWVILLTNRTYPTTTNMKIKAFRPTLHDQIWEDIGA